MCCKISVNRAQNKMKDEVFHFYKEKNNVFKNKLYFCNLIKYYLL